MDQRRSTYLPASPARDHLTRRLNVDLSKAVLETEREAYERAASRVLDHRFDLLGSGLVTVTYGTQGPGIEGIAFAAGETVVPDAQGRWLEARLPAASVADARSVWRLVDPGYSPIDWQLDFRSGYRWSERTWSRDIRFGDVRGADVKLPWELARMQHLPLLALAVANTGGDLADRCRREFRNEVLDFVATNPPRFGVNWTTTMDVAIRVSNWLIAHDLFLAGGAEFDAPFEAVLARSVREHGRHIAANLEWAEELRSNHYLADIVGLLFVAASLPKGGEVDDWLALARREVVAEGLSQFNEDGSNFEGSTSYHRLSGEMLTYAVALLMGLDSADRITPDLAARVERAAEFTIGMTKHDGRVAQVGDNDSGRFVKLRPDETTLDHRTFVAAVAGLTDRADLQRVAGPDAIETSITQSLAGGRRQSPLDAPSAAERLTLGGPEALAEAEEWLDSREPSCRLVYRIDVPGGRLREGLLQLGYPDFGAYVFRSDRLFLAIRCGPVGQNGLGGHAHNDQLAIELQVDGEDWLRDPGTYVYTSLPDRRNAYRSARAHAGPALESEPASLDVGLFELGPGTDARCLYWGPQGFAGRVSLAGGRTVVGRIHVDDDAIHLTYGVEGDRFRQGTDDWQALTPSVPFSSGYGVLEA